MGRNSCAILILFLLYSCSSKGDGTWQPGAETGGDSSTGGSSGPRGGSTSNPTGPVGSGGTGGDSFETGGTQNFGASGGTDPFGTGGTGGTGGTSTGEPFEPKLGAPCASAATCTSANPAVTLKCVLPTDTLLGGGPPKGMCSIECTAHSECERVHTGSYCVIAGESQRGYCFEGCAYGQPASPSDKCHGRMEFACSPVGADANSLVPICQPSCNGDPDCPIGTFCGRSGLCEKTAPVGKAFGEICDPEAATPECKGICLGGPSGEGGAGAAATCNQLCTMGAPCQTVRGSTKPGGACLFSISAISDPWTGDLGLCAQTCNSSIVCKDSTFKCVALNNANAEALYGAKGICAAPTATDTVLP